MNKSKSIATVFEESGLNTEDADALVAFLHTQRLEAGAEATMPWFVKGVTIVGAWLGSLLFVGFLFIAQIIGSQESMIGAGVVFIGAGIALSYVNTHKLLVDSLSLSLSIIGQIVLGAGVAIVYDGIQAVWGVGIIVEASIFLFAKSYTQKFLAVILMPLCMLGILINGHLYELTMVLIGALALATTLVWVYELPLQLWLKSRSVFFVPTAYGLVLALLVLAVLSIHAPFFTDPLNHWYVATIGSFLSLMFLLYTSLCQGLALSRKLFWLMVLLSAALFYPTAQAPGIITSALVLTLGFARSNRVLLTLGVVSLSIFIIAYYYSLQQTLLVKSLLLLSAGVLFLGASYLLAQVQKKGALA